MGFTKFYLFDESVDFLICELERIHPILLVFTSKIIIYQTKALIDFRN